MHAGERILSARTSKLTVQHLGVLLFFDLDARLADDLQNASALIILELQDYRLLQSCELHACKFR